MKKLRLVLISLILITTVGCSSTAVETDSPSIDKSNNSKQQNNELSSGLYYKNKLTKEKLLIDDWKYKGFGNDLPDWVIPALEENISEIKRIVPEISDAEIIILQKEGYNQDQSEKSLMELEKLKTTEGFKKYDSSFWVRAYPVKDKSASKIYTSIAVYYKLIES